MMAPAGVELEMLVSEPDALTTRPPPCAKSGFLFFFFSIVRHKTYHNTCTTT